MKPFQINEKHLSQIPALQLLIGMGFEFLTPAEALRERQDRASNVLLTVLTLYLKYVPPYFDKKAGEISKNL